MITFKAIQCRQGIINVLVCLIVGLSEKNTIIKE